MRVILQNEDAQNLDTLLGRHSGEKLTMECNPTDEDGKLEVVVRLGGREFRGIARPTPSSVGSFVIEDMDGRPIMEAS